MRIPFDSLRAIMPSGEEIRFPQDAELPALDIKQAIESRGRFTVYLGLPLLFDSRANAVSPGQAIDSRAKILYRVTEKDCPDENTGETKKPCYYGGLMPDCFWKTRIDPISKSFRCSSHPGSGRRRRTTSTRSRVCWAMLGSEWLGDAEGISTGPDQPGSGQAARNLLCRSRAEVSASTPCAVSSSNKSCDCGP